MPRGAHSFNFMQKMDIFRPVVVRTDGMEREGLVSQDNRVLTTGSNYNNKYEYKKLVKMLIYS